MMIKLIPFLVLSISMSLILTPTPLILGLWVFVLALMSSIMLSVMSSWVAMMIFLIYIGGLLVLFAYFLAIQPNQFTGVSTMFLCTALSFYLLISMPNAFPPWMSFSTSMPSIPFIMFTPNMPIIMLLAALLLLILVIVVKITSMKSGPLRPYTKF